MKIITLVLLVSLSLLVAACATPPSDVPSAQVVDTNPTPTPVVEEPAEEVVEEVQENEDEVVEETTDEAFSGSVAIDTAASTFEFEGYGPGKSHVGTFTDWSGTLLIENGAITAGAGTIQVDSVESDSGALDGVLKGSNFFNAEEYPEIIVTFSEVGADSITADLSFRGVTNAITFPAVITSNSITADFLIDTSNFGMSNAGVNDEVRIGFTFVAEN